MSLNLTSVAMIRLALNYGARTIQHRQELRSSSIHHFFSSSILRISLNLDVFPSLFP